ncbi:MAG: hypothetical protein IPJ89_00030 [Candidatus Iainarchaeum archaeon]|uniref:Alpha/beta hydrolase n=1 Tax=Candidatus Iainarchaeum sp. TaxID=3101447 RepID=A0A7T9DJS4_9ARCH|nr:MAG: hypothetical protein IPJ89_00030 [Candidatus Diapherotrites archaeon]
MEREIRIPLPEGKILYSVLNQKSDSKNLIILVHGLPGSDLDHPIFAASRYFPKRGFATLRINLYHWKPHARKLLECTTKTHGEDVTRAIDYSRKKLKFKKIFLAGHSWGGPSILFSDANQSDGISLWDPSSDLARCFPVKSRKPGIEAYAYNKPLNAYVADYGSITAISPAMLREARKHSTFKLKSLVRKIHRPIQFVIAQKGIWKKAAKKLFGAANESKSFTVIPGAFHSFQEEGKEIELFKATLDWFRKIK